MASACRLQGADAYSVLVWLVSRHRDYLVLLLQLARLRFCGPYPRLMSPTQSGAACPRFWKLKSFPVLWSRAMHVTVASQRIPLPRRGSGEVRLRRWWAGPCLAVCMYKYMHTVHT